MAYIEKIDFPIDGINRHKGECIIEPAFIIEPRIKINQGWISLGILEISEAEANEILEYTYTNAKKASDKMSTLAINHFIENNFVDGHGLIYCYHATKALLDCLDVNLKQIKRITNRFKLLNNQFRNFYQSLPNHFHKSLLRDRYFENKKLINKLIRLVKSKKFMI